MEGKLKIASYNCQGIKSSEPHVRRLCEQVHVLALQETWLYSDEVTRTNSLHNDYASFSLSAVEESQELRSGRPYGGLTFLWHKSLSKYIKILELHDSRILGLTYKNNNFSLLMLNVYLPTNSAYNREEQLSYLGKLASLMDGAQEEHICIIGDFNAAPNSEYYEDIKLICQERDLEIVDVSLLPPDSFTHVNHGCLSQTWLDHIVLSPCLKNTVTDCNIQYDSISSDHFPLTMELNINALPPLQQMRQTPTWKIKWNFHDLNKRQEYGRILTDKLRTVTVDPARLCCFQRVCRDPRHYDTITNLSEVITQCMVEAGRCVFGTTRKKWQQVPGWNEFVRDAHSVARVAFLEWRNHGSPRYGPLATEMRRTRARFKLCLRWCRAHESQLRAQSLATKLAGGDSYDFWKALKSTSPTSDSLPLRVDQAVGEEEIVTRWEQHYSDILNCVVDDVNKNDILNKLHDVSLRDFKCITYAEMRDTLKDLSNSEALGVDGLPSGAYKYAPPSLAVWLTVFVNACVSHQFIPSQVLKVIIIPLLKSKLKDPTMSANYRPIAIATILSKIIEKILLYRLEMFLYTADNQFGFKKSHSTEMCVWALKNVIDYYTSRSSPVYLCFLDASKAFDRVNYWKLFRKLLDRNTPKYLVNLLVFWYSHQEFLVRWGNRMSGSFKTSNGIRQGGILSPYLYNAYTDELSNALSGVGIGCNIHNKCINSLSYADDMVLIAPTANALQKLINKCHSFATQHDIIYNTTKTECMIIPPKNSKVNYLQSVELGGYQLKFVNRFVYLGHVITTDRTDDEAIQKQLGKLNSVGNCIIRKFTFCTREVILELFRSYCYSLYCNSLWSNYRIATINKLRVCHNDILKRLLGIHRWESSSWTFAVNHVKCLDVIRRNAVVSLKRRIEQSNNAIVTAIRQSSAYVHGPIYRRWTQLVSTVP